MGLVGYSDSEGSDEEAAPFASDSHPKTSASSKRSFKRVTDEANPKKIRVNLPGTTENIPNAEDKNDEPPSKKKKLGEGLGGGFNAMLPAPKRTGMSAISNAGSVSGLRKGVSLKTGATPGFTREPMESSVTEDEYRSKSNEMEPEKPGITEPTIGQDTVTTHDAKTEPPLKGKTTMFKPLSVARKPQKAKKKAGSDSVEANRSKANHQSASFPSATVQQKPKVSLFSSHTEDDRSVPSSSSNGDYQPMLYQSRSNDTDEITTEAQDHSQQFNTGSYATHIQTGGQSLDAVAQDLNLSAAAKRQLFGRSGKSVGANVMTFDMDAEYNANEEFRASQDMQEVRNPVRSIAPGKHSLRQLVNAAVGQKEALEESFATGRRNKKEAGSQYGW